MARIDLPDPENIEGPHAEAVQASKQRWGFVANIERAFAMWPELAMAEHDLTDAVMVDGELDPGLKEAISVVVSQVNACPYCHSHHTFQMEQAGRSEAEQRAINELDFDSLADPQERAALTFAETVANDPNRVTDDDVTALREAGFDDREILEIVTVIALFMFYNTFTTTLGLEIDSAVQPYRLE
ncbi:MAG: peroxidase-related enzyme [Halobacteriales archaeon]|nr:peroxidase-related enzyme [Halobacteriales archaeon]